VYGEAAAAAAAAALAWTAVTLTPGFGWCIAYILRCRTRRPSSGGGGVTVCGRVSSGHHLSRNRFDL